ncbi:uncharacterized protein [Manis javanica]|uniref:uncharacterized protein n=1 Tax=Manis javanica TaxID=9974 RepID=UPI003C6CD2BF
MAPRRKETLMVHTNAPAPLRRDWIPRARPPPRRFLGRSGNQLPALVGAHLDERNPETRAQGPPHPPHPRVPRPPRPPPPARGTSASGLGGGGAEQSGRAGLAGDITREDTPALGAAFTKRPSVRPCAAVRCWSGSSPAGTEPGSAERQDPRSRESGGSEGGRTCADDSMKLSTALLAVPPAGADPQHQILLFSVLKSATDLGKSQLRKRCR